MLLLRIKVDCYNIEKWIETIMFRRESSKLSPMNSPQTMNNSCSRALVNKISAIALTWLLPHSPPRTWSLSRAIAMTFCKKRIKWATLKWQLQNSREPITKNWWSNAKFIKNRWVSYSKNWNSLKIS